MKRRVSCSTGGWVRMAAACQPPAPSDRPRPRQAARALIWLAMCQALRPPLAYSTSHLILATAPTGKRPPPPTRSTAVETEASRM